MENQEDSEDIQHNTLVLTAKLSLSRAIATGGDTRIPASIRKKLASRPKAMEEVTEWLRGILDEFAVNEYTVAAKLAEGLQATKVIPTETGVLQVPDYFTQHKYLDTAARLLNLYPPTRQQLGTDGSGIVVRLTPAFGYAAIEEAESASTEDPDQ